MNKLKIAKLPVATKKIVKLAAFGERHHEFLFAFDGVVGMTDEELSLKINKGRVDASRRRLELVSFGLLDFCGVRKTSRGRNSQVWSLTKDGWNLCLKLRRSK